MTGQQFATLVRAKRVTRGKWVAKCPAHPDRHPSLSIAEGKRGVIIRCMSHGCETKEVLNALGLRFTDLFYDQKVSQQIRQRIGLSEQKEGLEKQLGLVIMLGVVEPDKRNYWAAAERRIRSDIQGLRCRLEPEMILQEWKERNFKRRLARIGWDGLWGQLEGTNVIH